MRRALHTVTLTALGLLIVLAGPTGELHMQTKPEPDRWVNLVCNAKDQGYTPAQTANWLVGQYGLAPAAAAQHTMNHCEQR